MTGSMTLGAIPAPFFSGIALIDADKLDARMYASLARVMEAAPIERKLAILRLMAMLARQSLALRRQQAIDDLWQIAEENGLIDRLGASWVQGALAAGFKGE